MQFFTAFGVDWFKLIAQILNFLIIVYLINRFGFRPMLRLMDERANRIRQGLEAAESAERDRALAQSEREAAVAEARKEAQAMIARATKIAEDSRQEILAEAKVEADKLVRARPRGDRRRDAEGHRRAAQHRRRPCPLGRRQARAVRDERGNAAPPGRGLPGGGGAGRLEAVQGLQELTVARQQTAARRYAEAAFQIGRSEKHLDEWERDLGTLRTLLAEPQMRALVRHPAVPYTTKERILGRLVGNEVGAGALRLVLLMIRRGRPRAIDAMVEHFEALLRSERGISRAEVRSALPLEEAQRTAVAARLRELTGTEIELTEQVDPALIGGIAVRIGDQLYDASVRSRLERLRARLIAV